jgi:act minimal PKS acyl carrier protein
MSKTMSVDDLRAILTACAGGDFEVPDGDISGISFEELGYDSLALIETAAVLKRDYGMDIADDEISEVRTPSELLDMINNRIGA